MKPKPNLAIPAISAAILIILMYVVISTAIKKDEIDTSTITQNTTQVSDSDAVTPPNPDPVEKVTTMIGKMLIGAVDASGIDMETIGYVDSFIWYGKNNLKLALQEPESVKFSKSFTEEQKSDVVEYFKGLGFRTESLGFDYYMPGDNFEDFFGGMGQYEGIMCLLDINKMDTTITCGKGPGVN